MQRRQPRNLTFPLLRPALAGRRGEMNSSTVVIIVLSIIGALMLVACVGVIAMGVFSFRQAATGARQAAQRAQGQNNLQMLGLALHNYHDVFRQLPPGGIYGEDGTEYHSWQAMLLPYVDQAPLYNRIDFHEPWDDPVNSGHFTTPIQAYLHPSITDAPFNDAGLAVSHYAGNSQLFLPNGSTGFRDIVDGTSNTMMAGEVAAGFKPWGDPTNLRDPAAGLGLGPDTFSGPVEQNGTQILLGDGSVRFVANGVNPAVMQALATPAGGEAVPPF